MKRTLIALALCSLTLTACSSSEPGTAVSNADSSSTEVPAGFECESLLPWFDVVRTFGDAAGEPYDADIAAAQVKSWAVDPTQAERDLGGLATVEVDENWNWGALTVEEQDAASEQIDRAAQGDC